ncbi:NAD(P)-dependent oxidoreductase [Collinsella sp. AGMB00827]|uniref:NAD(P)-dependent oxidoreductase n=1 Tax=Collinsella ureilytica TaxID=2869515 RepID=A0ABS7MHZ1_9ACTN|nr:NAD(P)-dependent oxidoreductase [Collinsella urealyticum]MBY4796992.1 NAD(P)-dependent oxidoreductase [Collinsella urealyticum]
MGTVVIFGATGTLGLYLTDRLATSDAGWQVVATGRRATSFFSDAYPGRASFCTCDITDRQSFESLPERADVVVHFAGALPAYMKGYDPYRYIEANVLGTLNVLEYARRSGASRVLFTQTISDYNGYFGKRVELLDDMPRKVPFSGDHSVYAITKCAAEDLCWNYREEYGIAAYSLRLPNIYCYMPEAKTLYHDGVPATSSYRLMIERAMAGEALEVWGDPRKGMDLIYVKDFCQMCECCMAAPASASGTYNVGTGHLTALEDMVRAIASTFNDPTAPSEIIYRPEKHDSVNYFMNVDKARKQLGYKPIFTTPELVFEDYQREMQINRFAAYFQERYGMSGAYVD